jgi:hypothetical protein
MVISFTPQCTSKNWQKGKLRMKVSLEFCPDEPEIKEPESLLQEIERKLNEATS